MAKDFTLRVAQQREVFRCNLGTDFPRQTRRSLLHGFRDKRRRIHREEPSGNAFREDDRNFSALDFFRTEELRRIRRGFARDFIHRDFVPVAAALDEVAKLVDAVANGYSARAYRHGVALVRIEEPRMVCDNRKIAVQVSAQVRDVHDFLGTRERLLFKFNAEVLEVGQGQFFKRGIVIRIVGRNLRWRRKRDVYRFRPLRMANGILDGLRNRFLGEAFRMGIAGTAILDDADTEPDGIGNLGILHLALKNGKAFGMRRGGDNVKLFRLALREVTHTGNCVCNIHNELLVCSY